MNAAQIERKLTPWLRMKLKKIASLKKCSLRECIIFCLEGVYTQEWILKSDNENKALFCRTGVHTRAKKEGGAA